MKTIRLIPGILLFSVLASFGQTSFHYSEKFTATCDEKPNQLSYQPCVYVLDDSIMIEDIIYNQCCPRFALRISEIENDTLYVTFTDTTSMLCDCMCYYHLKINAGKLTSENLKINFNGRWYVILPDDYQPLIEVGKKWNSLRLIPGLENTYPTQIEHTIESNETRAFCWNGKFYYKVKAKSIPPGDYVDPSDTVTRYIREENGKVYMFDHRQIGTAGCDEYLIYDFTLQVGDTVALGFDSIKYVVVPIGATEIQGRRCLGLADLTEPEMSNYTIWVEGVGDVRGLFQSSESLYMAGVMNVLTCCSVNGTYIYKNSEYPDCGIRPEYQFFIEEGKTWTTVIHCFLTGDTTFTTEVSITEDNMIYNLYSMRFYPFEVDTSIYYQEANGSVFYIDEDHQYLIYDFTLHPGDSVTVGDPDGFELDYYVDSVNYIQYKDDNLRKTLFLSGDINTIWVEGIGDLNSPLEYWLPLPDNGCIPDFACCSLQGELLYQDPQYPYCGNTPSVIQSAYSQFMIFPNPTSGTIEIRGLEAGRRLNYSIVDPMGKVLQEGELNSVIHLNLKSGIYYLLFREDNRNIQTKKLVIR